MSTHTPAQAPAIGCSLQIDLGNNTVLMLQTHYERDMPAHERAAIQDMLYEDGERMKAHVRIQAIGKEIEGINQQRALNAGQLERAEADYQAKKADRIRLSDESADADILQQKETGRRGPYELSTKAKQHQKAIAAQQLAADQERDQTLSNLQATEKMLAARIDQLAAEAQKLKGVVDGPYSSADR